MILDMHLHTAISDDSTASIDGYIEMILAYRAIHPFDGFVLTEHRQFTPDLHLQRYWDEYGVLVLQGVELDTNIGHLLVYGMNDRVLERIDVTQRMHDGRQIIAELANLGAVAVPAHPFRGSVFGSLIAADITEVAGVQVIEGYNGQNSRVQNDQAERLMRDHGLKGVGGSDAHHMNPHWFFTAATEFDDSLTSMSDVVEALHDGTYRPVVLPAPEGIDLPTPRPVLPRFF